MKAGHALRRYTTRLWRRGPPQSPPSSSVGRFGSYADCSPSAIFGSEWGQCIDRYYIESFLARHAADIHGHVLEVADNTYTRQFGGTSSSQTSCMSHHIRAPRSRLTSPVLIICQRP